MLKEFKSFIIRGNVIDMAIGLIIGAAFGKIVASFVSDILMPPIGLALGGVDFKQLVITLREASGPNKPVTVNYGLFLNQVLDFLIVASCIFFMTKSISAIKGKPPAPTPTEKKCPQCTMAIPLEAKRCPHCTSTL